MTYPGIRRRYFPIACVLVGGLLGLGVTFASGLEYKLNAVPTQVSGTLTPLVVAVDGKVVISKPGEFKTLLLNDKEIQTESTENSPFFTSVSEDVLRISAVRQNGERLELRTVNLPRAAIEEAAGSSTLLIEGAQELYIDGAKTALDARNTKRNPVALSGLVFGQPHGIELKYSSDMPGRSYDLNVIEKPRSSAWQSLELGFAGNFGRHGLFYRLGYFRSYESRVSVGIFAEHLSASRFRSASVEVLGGWQFVRRGHEGFRASWVEGGLYLRFIYGEIAPYEYYYQMTSYDGAYVQQQKVRVLQPGIYMRSELFQIWKIALNARAELTLPQIRNHYVNDVGMLWDGTGFVGFSLVWHL